MLGNTVLHFAVLINVYQHVGFCQEVIYGPTTRGNLTETAIVSPSQATEIPNSTAALFSEIIALVNPTNTTQLQATATELSITTKPTTVTPTTVKSPTTTLPITTFKTTAKSVTTKKLAKDVDSPYAGGYDQFKVFAECCWELRLMYYWECDLWLKQCCLNPDITEHRPLCSSTGPGYRMWWKPYRRIFYNECAATKYLCESLPPLSVPWKCMWRRDQDHPHCSGSKKDVIRETEPPVMDCSRYGLQSIGRQNEVIPPPPPEINFYKHPTEDASMPNWKLPYPAITLSTCGDIQRPKEPEPVLLYPPTTPPPLVRFQELQELRRIERQHKINRTTVGPLTSQQPSPPLMEIMEKITPDEEGDIWSNKMSLWAILLGVFTVLFIISCFMFSLWFGSKATTEEQRRLRQS